MRYEVMYHNIATLHLLLVVHQQHATGLNLVSVAVHVLLKCGALHICNLVHMNCDV